MILEKKSETIDDKFYYYVDITFNDELEEVDLTKFPFFDHIIFKNYYTQVLNIFIYHNEKWKSILSDFILMKDSDCDEDGEKYFIINKKQLSLNFESEKPIQLIRLYLSQESTIWNTFHISDISFIKDLPDVPECPDDCKIKKEKDRLEFKSHDNSMINLITDKDEMNQKYIDLMKVGGDKFKLKYFG